MKVLIFGASGAGTTTLSHLIAKRNGFEHLDLDRYYWQPTYPPFQQKVPFEERINRLTRDFEHFSNAILSGSMVNWGKQWQHAFDLGVFIYLDPKVRLQRLMAREKERYGNLLQSDKIFQEHHKAFIDWAVKYDDPNFTGRSLKVHLDWAKKLSYPILKLDGELPLDDKVGQVCDAITLIEKACD